MSAISCYADWAGQVQDNEAADNQDDEAAERRAPARGPAFERLLAAGHERDAASGLNTAPAVRSDDWSISAVHRGHGAAADSGSSQGSKTAGETANEIG